MEVSNVIQFTDTIIGNVDPVFEHRMSFLVNDPRSDTIKIHILVTRMTYTVEWFYLNKLLL